MLSDFFTCHYRHLIIYVALPYLMQQGMTALHFAGESGDLEVANALLERGAAIDLQDNVRLLFVTEWSI